MAAATKRKPKGKARWQTTEKQDKENARIAEIRNIAHETVMNALAPVTEMVKDVRRLAAELTAQAQERATRHAGIALKADGTPTGHGIRVAHGELVGCVCGWYPPSGGDPSDLFAYHLAAATPIAPSKPTLGVPTMPGHQPVFNADCTQVVRCTCGNWTADSVRSMQPGADSDQLWAGHLLYVRDLPEMLAHVRETAGMSGASPPDDAKQGESVHFVDIAPGMAADRPARCGARFNGMTVTANVVRVTCLKCLAALGIVSDAMPTLPLSAPIRDLANEDILRELRATVAARDRQVTTLLKALGDRAPAVGAPRTTEALVAFARAHRPVTILEGRITACVCGREFSATPEVDTSELFVRHVAGLALEAAQA